MLKKNLPVSGRKALSSKRKNSADTRGTPTQTLPHLYYPAFLNLKGKTAVVIGGGKVAERKVLSLLKAGSGVKVISPKLTKRIEKEKLKGRIKHIPRQYRKSDLKNAFLVIAATDSQVINDRVSKDAPSLVNVVDIPDLCNLIVPSVMNRGPLNIAVSTSGISPALSRSIRKELEKLYGPEFNNYLKLLKKIRLKATKIIDDKKKRREFLKAIASGKMMRMLRQKGFKETGKVVVDLFRKAKRNNALKKEVDERTDSS
ncbi:MAG: bifunctional precorrin-2 dehydrogenase/sirohydrochlorin ferrochelatase [Nitrospirota bacterium]